MANWSLAVCHSFGGFRHLAVMLWLRFYQRQTMEVLIEGLESAFGWFNGMPQDLPTRQGIR